MEWFSENLGSLIVLFCVLLLLFALILGLWRRKKRKPDGCAGGCACCPYAEGCQGKHADP